MAQPSVTAIVVFLLLMAVTVVVAYWAARRTHSTEDFFAAGRRVNALQNGLAIAAGFLAAASFVGLPGLISLIGIDALLYPCASLFGFALMVFLIAEPVRNLGKYTFADVLARRFGGSSSLRAVAAICTIYLVLNYLLQQIVGAGNLIGLMFHIPYDAAVVIIGVVMLVYVLFGGMIATTWIQVIECVLVVIVSIVLAAFALAAFGFHITAMFKAAAAQDSVAALTPGPIESISVALSVGLGVASLPHVLMRFYTVPDARTARRSLFHAMTILVIFFLMICITGFGARALLGPRVIQSADPGGNMAVPLLAERLGGTLFLGFVAAIFFAVILAVTMGLAITGAAALSHDIWVNVVCRGQVNNRQQLVVARIATVLLFVASITLGILFRGQNIAFLVGLSTAAAASANFPVLILALFWRRLTTAGAISGMIAGLGVSVLMIYLSPLVQVGILHHAAPVIGLRTPGLVTCPFAFLVAIAVSFATYRETDSQRYEEMQRRMLMGAEEHAEAAV
jgi:cation/acetate symporter